MSAGIYNFLVKRQSFSYWTDKAGGKTLTNIEVFDVYVGKNIEEGKRSIAFSLTFEDYSKTLTDEEVMNSFNKVIKEVENKYNATLRNC